MRANNSRMQWQGPINNSDYLQEIRHYFRSGHIKENADLYAKLCEMGRRGRSEEAVWAIH